ncbi:unnamed protein product [Rangifer tarandus platyrhynchus]|uniref:Uncharacterized protein n=1 Tax=Rangifer tarandus platyrhynchus TaxID=3082113 RepID=A0ABN8ZYY7_RANTA|nr:unnamed protein product [Rangifer tarandus platyrhynchus]
MGPGRPQPQALLPQRRAGGDTGGAERCWSPGSSRFSKLGTVAFQGTGRFPPAPPWCLLPEELPIPSKVKVKLPCLGWQEPGRSHPGSEPGGCWQSPNPTQKLLGVGGSLEGDKLLS